MLVPALLTALAVPTTVTAVADRCAGADPAIVSARVVNVTPEGGVNRYHLSATVKNLGTDKQASNVLQSVVIYQNGVKVDARGVPPLAPNASYTVTHDYLRATDAGNGTTPFHFVLKVLHKTVPGPADCNASNDQYDLSV